MHQQVSSHELGPGRQVAAAIPSVAAALLLGSRSYRTRDAARRSSVPLEDTKNGRLHTGKRQETNKRTMESYSQEQLKVGLYTKTDTV